MDENDRMNLKFLLDASEEIIKHWYLSVDEDDHTYASSLLTLAYLELTDDCKDTDITEQYLRKYRL
jgi:hypothetical protein